LAYRNLNRDPNASAGKDIHVVIQKIGYPTSQGVVAGDKVYAREDNGCTIHVAVGASGRIQRFEFRAATTTAKGFPTDWISERHRNRKTAAQASSGEFMRKLPQQGHAVSRAFFRDAHHYARIFAVSDTYPLSELSMDRGHKRRTTYGRQEPRDSPRAAWLRREAYRSFRRIRGRAGAKEFAISALGHNFVTSTVTVDTRCGEQRSANRSKSRSSPPLEKKQRNPQPILPRPPLNSARNFCCFALGSYTCLLEPAAE